jgi:FemAB-related protein (PEP-CTERM system-associated)
VKKKMVEIIEVMQDDYDQWEKRVCKNPNHNFVDHWYWGELIEKVYGISCYRFIVKRSKQIVGYVCISHCSHPILGNYLVTAPFDNYGGVFWQKEDVREAILAQSIKLRDKLNADYVLIRHRNGSIKPPSEWHQNPIYSTFILSLKETPEYFLKNHLRAKQRNQLKKSFENELFVKWGGSDLLNVFFNILSKCMHELGSPSHSKKFFSELLANKNHKAEIIIVYLPNGKPIGGGLIILDGKTAVLYHANILIKYRLLCAGDFLYWNIIKHCYEKSEGVLDLGRSLAKSGNEHFKMKWNPEQVQLAYWYNFRSVKKFPGLNQANPKFRIAVWIWKRMPLFITRVLSPAIIKGLI